MMTETEMEYKVTDGIYDYIPNQCLTDLVYDNMVLLVALKILLKKKNLQKNCVILLLEKKD